MLVHCPRPCNICAEIDHCYGCAGFGSVACFMFFGFVLGSGRFALVVVFALLCVDSQGSPAHSLVRFCLCVCVCHCFPACT